MTGPGWPSERGWLTVGALVLFIYVISLVAFVPDLDKFSTVHRACIRCCRCHPA